VSVALNSSCGFATADKFLSDSQLNPPVDHLLRIITNRVGLIHMGSCVRMAPRCSKTELLSQLVIATSDDVCGILLALLRSFHG
jgi:hypothetical protein